MNSQSKSGDKPRRKTTSLYLTLDVRLLQRNGLLASGKSFTYDWKRGDRAIAGIRGRTQEERVILSYWHRRGEGEWEFFKYEVQLTWTTCNFRGERGWFLCPGENCGRRVAILYSGEIFACRQCKGLVYDSQRSRAGTRRVQSSLSCCGSTPESRTLFSEY